MTQWLICRHRELSALLAALAFAAIVLGARPAKADDLTAFNAAIERAAEHNRVAIGYLRTESLDLASYELDKMKDAWGDLTGKFGGSPPQPLRDNPLYTEALVDVPTRIVTAMMMVNIGRTDIAGNSLQAIRVELSKMRRESGIEVLADCVLDYNNTMAQLLAYDETAPDWSRANTAAELAARTAAVEKVSQRCDGMAGPLRERQEFRRLIDGTLASLKFVPQVIETRDNELLHRVLGELRALDNLLAFRYG
ncbi:MAG: hypothetical protein ACXWJW_12835 [Xanthobacteraceae bacterium]